MAYWEMWCEAEENGWVLREKEGRRICFLSLVEEQTKEGRGRGKVQAKRNDGWLELGR